MTKTNSQIVTITNLLRTLPTVILTVRTERGLTQTEAARQIGLCSNAELSRYEKGARRPNIGTLLKILDWMRSG